MNNVVDRVPTEVLANGAVRWEQFDSSGNSLGYVYLKRADEPTEVGTPINKVLFDSIKADLLSKWNYSDISIGTYTGDGTDERTINLGYTPRAVFVECATPRLSNNARINGESGFAVTASPVYSQKGSQQKVLEIVTNGFKVYQNQSQGTSYNENMNYGNSVYNYIAFK